MSEGNTVKSSTIALLSLSMLAVQPQAASAWGDDMHQPLHASDNNDAGGNAVKVMADGFDHKSRDNLHGFWDTQFVEVLGRPPAALAKQLLSQITPEQEAEWRQGRHRGLGSAVAELARLSMTASRRLQLAAEESGTIGIALRRWRRQAEASDCGHPTAATTRWRISALPSTPLSVPGIGRPRWLVELVRCRAGESGDFELEACDDRGHLRLPADHSGRPERRAANGLALLA
jgi:hypothetical protein